jgi:hypothetical protein
VQAGKAGMVDSRISATINAKIYFTGDKNVDLGG